MPSKLVRRMSVLAIAAGALPVATARRAGAATVSVSSPSGNIAATITFTEATGSLSYTVTSLGTTVIGPSPMGISTSLADFTTGMSLLGSSPVTINETYSLPVGKRSTYLNRAQEVQIRLSKTAREMQIHFRAYDDGIAFRYHLPGTGGVSISAEGTGFRPPGDVTYYGMEHPNRWGYESNLRKLVTETNLSIPVLIEAPAVNHWLLVGQAATYGTYVIPWLQQDGGLLRVRFPLDQAAQGPVSTTLPFRSPWRMVIVSPGTLARIVESVMVENLNPPTDSALVNASWLKPGRASWDYINKLYDQIPTWIDFDAEMGWQSHVMEGGWESRYSGEVDDYTAYAASKGTSLFGWSSARANNTVSKATSTFTRFNTYGVKGAKVDFFDRNPATNTVTDDYEDTQASLQQRDIISTVARDRQILLVYHGCAIPSGERRRWPHILGLEAVNGLEHHPVSSHDVTIPFIRNVMGPVDYTPIDYSSTYKTAAGQAATAVVFETGLQIYAPSYTYFRTSVAYDFFRRVPATWDDTRLIEGYPESHATLARRKGGEWYVGSITNLARTATIPLSFLSSGATYTAEIYREGASIQEIVKETRAVTDATVLSQPLMPSGGVAIRIFPTGVVRPTPTPTPTPTPPSGFTEITPPASAVAASTHDGNLPANTVDNNLSTRWSANGDGQWIRYDLGAPRTIAFVRIAVYNGNSRQNRFDLQVSNDLAAWQDVITGGLTSGTTTAEQVHELPDVTARYLRYVGHGSTVGTFNSLTEVSLFAPAAPPGPTPTPTPTPSTCVTASAGAGWQNRPFPRQAGTFVAAYDATPQGGAGDAVVALSLGPQTSHAGFAALVSFSSSGQILARNGSAYTAQAAVPWSAGTSYRFRLAVDVPARTYSIFVRPTAGGTEQTIGSGFAFRTEQAGVAALDNYGVVVGSASGSLQVCGFSIAVP